MDSTTNTSSDVTSVAAPTVTSLEIVLPISGISLRIDKLKSGKYYQAQKIYTDWLGALQSVVESGQIDVASIMLENGELDKEKYKDALQKSSKVHLDQVVAKAEELSNKRLELIACCLNTSIEALQESYYPEDLDVIMEAVVKLNKFMSNLKKSVAPIADIEG